MSFPEGHAFEHQVIGQVGREQGRAGRGRLGPIGIMTEPPKLIGGLENVGPLSSFSGLIFLPLSFLFLGLFSGLGATGTGT